MSFNFDITTTQGFMLVAAIVIIIAIVFISMAVGSMGWKLW